MAAQQARQPFSILSCCKQTRGGGATKIKVYDREGFPFFNGVAPWKLDTDANDNNELHAITTLITRTFLREQSLASQRALCAERGTSISARTSEKFAAVTAQNPPATPGKSEGVHRVALCRAVSLSARSRCRAMIKRDHALSSAPQNRF